MNIRRKIAGPLVAGSLVLLGVVAAPASAAISPSNNAPTVAGPIPRAVDSDSVVGAQFTVLPSNGNPAATSNSDLALFPLSGPNYSILSTGDTTVVDGPNDSNSTSNNNNGDGGGHGSVANDLVTLRIDLDVPDNRNCLSIDYRFLTEEFPEYIGSQYNDTFLIELDQNDFEVSGSGVVTAPSNFAFGPDGKVTTVNAAGTSADNALGTTYDGATPILRATTPISSGAHSVYVSIYDASDHIYDSSAFVDNLALRNTKAKDCKRGAAPNEDANGMCQGKEPTIIASGGVASGTKGKDVILGSDGDDRIRGRGGDDIICGAGGDDEINGNAGDDDIAGNAGDDLVYGNGGKDEIKGLRDRDEIHGQSGNDRITGGSGNDLLLGGNGNDRLAGNQGNDTVRGRVGNDDLQGNKDRDKLGGGRGSDRCRGGTGKDSKTGCESR